MGDSRKAMDIKIRNNKERKKKSQGIILLNKGKYSAMADGPDTGATH